jgi:hypothetical protein
MKIDRLTHEPGLLLEFYQDGLGSLGALCERTWHDRLEVVAEGAAAKLWNQDGNLHAVELQFVPAEATSARDAAREVFPGCPLTFRLAKVLRPRPTALERLVLADTTTRAPDVEVAARLWRTQFPDTARWEMASGFKADYHFSLVCLVRCEIQAIDQHWSLHRVVLSLPDGESDDHLARELGFQQARDGAGDEINWPVPAPAQWNRWLQQALESELADDLEHVRTRQENSLRRDLDRIDDYFENYQQELIVRADRSSSANTKTKIADRLASAKAEHARRRADQVARHEIRVQPHLDALLLIAETAWSTQLRVERAHRPQTLEASFIPRARRWELRP